MFDDIFSLNGPYSRFMNWLWNVLVISVLWIICCFPVVTIGASCTAAYYTAAKVIRHKTGKAASAFFTSFRTNLKQSIFLTCTVGAVMAILLVECIYLYSDSSVPTGMLYLFYLMALCVQSCMNYLWPCLSRFSQTGFAFLRMSVLLMFRHLPTTVLLLLIQAIVFFGIYLMPWGILLFPGIGFYVETYLMEKILRKYSPVVSDDDPEAQKWYYQ